MADNQDLRKLIADIRAHVEYQRALGVRSLGIPSPGARPVPVHAAVAPKPAPLSENRALPASAEVSAPEEQPASVAAPPSTLEAVRETIGDCHRCKLDKGRNAIVFGDGDPRASILFVGEGPGYEEDQQGLPFVGAAGQLLTDIIEKGIKIKRSEVYICNIVKCRPPGNRNPEPEEIEACIGFVKQQIAVIKPKVIVTLGNVPTQNLLGTKQGITKMRGVWQEYNGIPVMPTFHPSYLLRSPGEKKWVWRDIQEVMKKLGMAMPDKA